MPCTSCLYGKWVEDVCTGQFVYLVLIVLSILSLLPSVAYDPEGRQKLDPLQNTTKLTGMTCHLINKAVIIIIVFKPTGTKSQAGKLG